MNPEDIKTTVKTLILSEYLPGEDPAALTDDTPLMTTGILNSIAVLKVVTSLGKPVWYYDQATRCCGREPQYIIGHRPARDVEESVTRRPSGMRSSPLPLRRIRRHSYTNFV